MVESRVQLPHLQRRHYQCTGVEHGGRKWARCTHAAGESADASCADGCADGRQRRSIPTAHNAAGSTKKLQQEWCWLRMYTQRSRLHSCAVCI